MEPRGDKAIEIVLDAEGDQSSEQIRGSGNSSVPSPQVCYLQGIPPSNRWRLLRKKHGSEDPPLRMLAGSGGAAAAGGDPLVAAVECAHGAGQVRQPDQRP